MTLEFDGQNNKLGINTSSPTAKLQITAESATSGEDLIKLANGADACELVIDTSANAINFKTGTGDALVFAPEGTEIARFTSAGLAIGGTGSANTLDDYEEGTFTPTLSFGTATTQAGSYIKVGNVCHCFMNIVDLTDTTTASGISITLPFTCKSGDGYQSVATVMYRNVTILNNSSISGFLNDNQSNLLMYQDNAGGNWSLLTYSEITGVNGGLKIQLTYFTA